MTIDATMRLVLAHHNAPVSGDWLRVPSEDRTVTVEE